MSSTFVANKHEQHLFDLDSILTLFVLDNFCLLSIRFGQLGSEQAFLSPLLFVLNEITRTGTGVEYRMTKIVTLLGDFAMSGDLTILSTRRLSTHFN